MHFCSSCITRYYITQSEMGFLRGNGVFPPQQSNLVCWPGCVFGVLTTGHCTDVFVCSCFTEKLVRFRVLETEARGAAKRAEVLGESWLPALQQWGSTHGRMGEQEKGLSGGVPWRKGNDGAKWLKKKQVLACHCTEGRCPFFPLFHFHVTRQCWRYLGYILYKVKQKKCIFDP